MPHIFISYRRVDSQEITGRIYDWVSNTFGEDSVFMDTEHLRPGAKWKDKLRANVLQCNIMLVIIGQLWQEELSKRIGQDDWVFEEVTVGLLEKHITLIPVLVNGATFPQLPEQLITLSDYQTKILRSEPGFRADIRELIDDIKSIDAISTQKEAIAQSINQSGDFNFAGNTDNRGATFTKTVTYGGEHPQIPLLRTKDSQLQKRLSQLSSQLKAARDEAYIEKNVQRDVRSGSRGMHNLLGLFVPIFLGGIAYNLTNWMIALVVAVISLVLTLVAISQSSKQQVNRAPREQSAVARLQQEIVSVQTEKSDLELQIEVLQEEWARKHN